MEHRKRPHRPARVRARASTARSPHGRGDGRPDRLFVYGIHAVAAALANPARRIEGLWATRNALARLAAAGAAPTKTVTETTPRELDRMLGGEAVHQGVVAAVAPLDPLPLSAIARGSLVVVLDQITDPHNVGAILRSAAAFGADGVVTTSRHAPQETGVLAKAASGALDAVPLVFVQNLARALDELGESGFIRVGLDSTASESIDDAVAGNRIALVLGAEGKGLRRLTRDTCDRLARIPTAGVIASLNVSNAAALALFVATRHLAGRHASPPGGGAAG